MLELGGRATLKRVLASHDPPPFLKERANPYFAGGDSSTPCDASFSSHALEHAPHVAQRHSPE